MTIPDSVTEIDDDAFSQCSNLSNVILSKGLTSLGYDVFYDCDALTSIAIPKSLESCHSFYTSHGPFKNCSNLKNVSFESGTTEIVNNLFYGCDGLEQITIPDTVKTIKSHAFELCSGLNSVKIPDSVTSIENDAFADCTSLKTITIPNSVESMGTDIFSGCSSLESATLPNTLTSLGNYAFKGCEALTDIHFGTGLKSIGTETFMDCASLQKVMLPYSIESIGSNAFKNDTKLTEIYIPVRTSSINATAFSYPKKMTIYGIEGSYAQEFAKEKDIAFVISEAKPKKITLSATEVSVDKNKTTQLFVTIAPAEYMGDVEWISSDETIATVDKYGKVTAKSGGTTTITCTAGEVSTSAAIQVQVPVSKISLNKSHLDMEVGDTYELIATISPSEADSEELIYESANTSIAAVDENGKITAVGEGETTITVKTPDGTVESSCTVTVTKPTLEFKMGDVNRDGKISASDALKILEYAAGLIN